MNYQLHRFLSNSFPNKERHKQITPTMLINYRSTLSHTDEWNLGALKKFLKRWVDLGYGGVDPEIVPLLNSWRLKGNIKGLSVQIQCPHTGALSDLEFEALQQALIDAFEPNDISLDDFVLAMLFLATGRRPAQLADLKSMDLIEAKATDGLAEFVLSIPRRKRRGGGWREDSKPFALTPENGKAVQLLIQENQARLLTLQPDLDTEVLRKFPIFPRWSSVKAEASSPLVSFTQLLWGEAFHTNTEDLRRRLENTVASLSVPSERTGAPLRVFPLRCRRTIGTRAAREGYGVLVIAELLDHDDTQNAGVYTENVPEHVNALNEAVARQLAPLAQAFAGVLVNSESDALRGGDSTSRVRTQSGASTGTCGHFGFCGALSPIACYTCRHFQAWLDGAHDEVLQALLAERTRILSITQDKTIASVNDRTIFAVAEVVRRCESRRAELDGGTHIG